MSFALTLEVGQSVIVSPHETTVLAFAFAFPFASLEVVVHVSPELADGFACEASPRPPCFTVLHVNVFGCFRLGHLGDPWIW